RAPLEIAGLGELLLPIEGPFLGVLATDEREREVDVLADLVAVEIRAADGAEAIGGEEAQARRDGVAPARLEGRRDEGDARRSRPLVDLDLRLALDQPREVRRHASAGEEPRDVLVGHLVLERLEGRRRGLALPLQPELEAVRRAALLVVRPLR